MQCQTNPRLVSFCRVVFVNLDVACVCTYARVQLVQFLSAGKSCKRGAMLQAPFQP